LCVVEVLKQESDEITYLLLLLDEEVVFVVHLKGIVLRNEVESSVFRQDYQTDGAWGINEKVDESFSYLEIFIEHQEQVISFVCCIFFMKEGEE
jgi:hypothetical protein